MIEAYSKKAERWVKLEFNTIIYLKLHNVGLCNFRYINGNKE